MIADRHDHRAERREDRFERGCGDAIGGGLLHRAERQGDEIGDVGEQIERDDDHRAEGQRQGNVASRILDLAGGEGDVVPGVGGKERPDLRHAQRDEQAEGRRRVEARARAAPPRGCPEVAEIARDRLGFQPTSRPTTISARSAPVLAVVKTFWIHLAPIEPAGVRPGQQRDQQMPSSCAVESETA